MKKTASVLLSLILMLISFVPAFAADYYCTLKPSSSNVDAGDVITVDLNASAGLSGINVLINYDIEKFEFIESTEGRYMDMTVSNADKPGEIQVVAVSQDVVKSEGTVFTFRLRVLSGGGKITTIVREALADGENDISSLIKNESITIKASGKAERQTPLTNVATTVLPQDGTQAAAPDASSKENGSSGNPETTTRVAGEVVEASAENASDSAASVTDESGEAISDEEFRRESNTGLIIASVVGVLALCAVVAIILKKKSDSKSPEKADTSEK